VYTIGDLADRRHLRFKSSAELGVPALISNDWRRAIPDTPRARLQLHDVDLGGTVFDLNQHIAGFFPHLFPVHVPFVLGRVPQSYDVSTGHVRLELLRVRHDGSVEAAGRPGPRVVPAQLDLKATEARLARVSGIDFFDGFVQDQPFGGRRLGLRAGKSLPDGSLQWVPTALLSTADIRRALLAASVGAVVEPECWVQRLAPQRVNWSKVWKWAYCAKHRSRQQCDLIYKLLHNALQTGHRNRWRPGVTGLCAFGCDALEDAVHLFCDCSVSHQAWAVALNALQRLTGRTWRLTPLFVVAGRLAETDGTPIDLDGDLVRANIILHACAVQTIWRLRCGVAMDGAEVPTQPLMAQHLLSLAKDLGLNLPE